MTENFTVTDKDNFPRMMTIKQTAKTGILREHTLRMMEKAGQLPSFKVGRTKKVLINYDALLVHLQSLGMVSQDAE